MSAIQKRILRHLVNGNELSIRNMFIVRISNCSREVRRQVEQPLGIQLHREEIKWKDDLGSGYYFEYRLNPQDKERVLEHLTNLK